MPTVSPHLAPPLDAPWYGAPFGAATRRAFQKYAVFRGLASRSEYWWFTLATSIVGIALMTLIEILGYRDKSIWALGSFASPGDAVNLLNTLVAAATLVPSLALTWRRLHDTGRSGWCILFALIPIVGGILLIVWLASRTASGRVRFDVGDQPVDHPAAIQRPGSTPPPPPAHG